MAQHILSIDQGTTSSRAIIFDDAGKTIAVAQQEFPQHFPQSGWVEHNPEDIWSSTLKVTKEAINNASIDASDIAAIGITNQRETTLVWDRATGEPLYNAIVWQDRRTAEFCEGLKNSFDEKRLQEKTGLIFDPYFSASKIAWILDNTEGARERAEKGELAFGTVDTFLLWRLSGGKEHATDATNASRTSLFNVQTQEWDEELLELFNIPKSMLPEVKDCSADFGLTDEQLLGAAIPVCGMVGDQQGALVGQACFRKGMVKSTYGTGCFMIKNTGQNFRLSNNRLLSTIAYRLNGEVTYALEGSIFVAGAAVQWLRDGLKLISMASETESLARQVGLENSVYFVPAFTGLGAPYWDPNAKGAIYGLTRDTGIAEVVTAGLLSACYQSYDLLEAMTQSSDESVNLRVDGGMVVNDWLTQSLSDILGCEVIRPQITETTALGAAYLAGLQVGIFKDLNHIESLWAQEARFEPNIESDTRKRLVDEWKVAVKRTLENQ